MYDNRRRLWELEREVEYERSLYKKRQERYLLMLGIVTASAASGIAFLQYYKNQAARSEVVSELLESRLASVEKGMLAAQASSLEELRRHASEVLAEQVDNVILRLEAASSDDTGDVGLMKERIDVIALSVEALSHDVKESGSNVQQVLGLYSAIKDMDGEQAIALPLLRSEVNQLEEDIEAIREEANASQALLKADMDKAVVALTNQIATIYDFGKWFLGMIMAAMIVPLIKPLFEKKSKRDDRDQQEEEDEEVATGENPAGSEAATSTPMQ